MTFIIDRKNFLSALNIAACVIEARLSSSPILGHVLIKGKGNSLQLTACGPEMELSVTTDCRLETEFECTVPSRKLIAICQSLSEDAEIQGTLDQDHLKLSSGTSKFRLNTLPVDDFPTMEELRSESSFKLPCPLLERLLERTAFSMAQQDAREYLQGMLVDLGSEYLRTVATDGHRLALNEVSVQLDRTEATKILLPRKTVERLGRLIAKKPEDITVELGERHARFALKNLWFVSRLISAEYPDYQSVIPKPSEQFLETDIAGLKQGLERASSVLDESQPRITVQLQKDQLRLEAENTSGESAKAEVPVDYQGAEMTIGFNWTYLKQALDKISGERVQIHITDANSSCLLLPEKEEGSKFVVMPMRL